MVPPTRHPRPWHSPLAALFVLCAAAGNAQEHPISVRLSDRAPVNVRPGAMLPVTVVATIPVGWHLYGVTQPPGGPIPTSFGVGPDSLFRLDPAIDAPVPRYVEDPNFGITSAWHEDSALFRIGVHVARTGRGRHTLAVRVGYQACTDRYCLPPMEDTLRLPVAIAGPPIVAALPAPPVGTSVSEPSRPPAPTAESPASATPRPAFDGPDETRGSRSLALFLWTAVAMGALALLTPCVFPMIPITISYFSQRDRGRTGAVGGASLYALGIIAAFTLLGLGASLAFGVAGISRFAANAWLNLAIGALFIVFALSLFGVLEIAVPARVLNAVDRAARATNAARVGTPLLMGAVFALTTFTCTAPFVGTLLVSAATGDWRWPAAGLFLFASAFALPFFILALVPNSLARLPRSGGWLVTMKGTLAFIELAAAMKFISNADLVEGWGLFPRDIVLATWIAFAVLLALYLAGFGRQRDQSAAVSRHPVAVAGALLVAAWLATGLGGRRLGELEAFLPPAGASTTGVAGDELEWMTDDMPGALALAAAEQKLVLIDFTGFTCTNCRWMEANMFPREDVQRELERFVRVRLFTDGSGDQHRRQQQFERSTFRTVALPLYAIVDSLGNPRATFLGMTRDAKEFLEFLTDARTTQ